MCALLFVIFIFFFDIKTSIVYANAYLVSIHLYQLRVY